jgi:Zn-dependent protease with chaperone function
MGYLFHLLAALVGQGVAEAGWTTGWRAPWAVAALVVIPPALALGARQAFLKGHFRSSALLSKALTACAPVLSFVALCALGWMDSTRAWLGFELADDAWPRLDMLAGLIPFVVYELAAIDARARSLSRSGRDRSSWRRFQFRMLLSAIVPLIAYVALTSAIGTSRTIRIEIEEVPLFGAAFAAGLLLILALALPTLLRNVWDTTPMPAGLQRDVLDAVATRARFRARSILTWNTDDLMANAAIVGIGRRTRIVLFSDSLLAQLDLAELAAVFAHEIGHAVRRHVLYFVVWAAGFFLLADLVASQLFADDVWTAGGFLLAAVVAWLLVFGYVSRRCELEADLYCLELLGDGTALVRALEKVGGHLRDVASWRHFSTADRVRFLAGVAHDRRVGERLRRKLSIWKRCGAALFVLALGLQLWSLSGTFRSDRLRADLRLGRYREASERIGEPEGLDPGLVRLAERVAVLGDEPVPVSMIESRARKEFAASQPESGLAWLDLGALRGDREMATVARAIRRLAAGEVTEQGLLEVPELTGWRAEVAACARSMMTRSAPAVGAIRADPPEGDQ